MFTGELIAGVGYLGTYVVFLTALGRLPPFATAGLVIVCLGIIEFFWSMTDVGFRAAIAIVTTDANRGRFMGALELIGLGGMGGGLFLAGHLYKEGRGFENGALWFLAAGFILAGVPLIAVTLMHLDRSRLAEPDSAPSTPFEPAFRRYMLALAVAVLGAWSFLQIHSFFVRLPGTAAASDEELSWIRFAFWVTGAVAAPVAGSLVDRVGSRRVYAWSLLACALVPVSFLATRSVVYAALTLGVYGAAFTAFRTASYTLAAELTPERSRGRHFALYNVVMSLGWGVSAVVVGGPVADIGERISGSARTGYSASFVVGGAVALIGLLLFLAGRRPPGGSRSAQGDTATPSGDGRGP